MSKYTDPHHTAIYPWWALYLDAPVLVGLEAASLTFLFFDLLLNLFAQGSTNFYRAHPWTNGLYTLILLW